MRTGDVVWGRILAIDPNTIGDALVDDHVAGESVLRLYSTRHFSIDGGVLRVGRRSGAELHDYLSLDEDAETLTMADGLLVDRVADAQVFPWPVNVIRFAHVRVDDHQVGAALVARVHAGIDSRLPGGTRAEGAGEWVRCEFDGDSWVVTDIYAGGAPVTQTIRFKVGTGVATVQVYPHREYVEQDSLIRLIRLSADDHPSGGSLIANLWRDGEEVIATIAVSAGNPDGSKALAFGRPLSPSTVTTASVDNPDDLEVMGGSFLQMELTAVHGADFVTMAVLLERRE